MSFPRASLSFKRGSADKVYNAAVVPKDDGYLVKFSYGRRGKPLKHGLKTSAPVELAKAVSIFEKLVTSKVAKGYVSEDEDTYEAVAVAEMAQERTEWLPQLLNPIGEENVRETFRGFRSNVIVQTKHDGERRAIIHQNGELYGANRRGLRVPLAHHVEMAFRTLTIQHELGDFILDAEDMGEYVVVFDCCRWERQDLRNHPFRSRRDVVIDLENLCNKSNILDAIVCDYGVAVTNENDLWEFIHYAKDMNEEGVVIRDPEGLYKEGRPNSGGPCIKLKFYATVTCRVASIHDSKRSIGLELADENGMFDFVGNCTIPPNYDIPNVGDLVEIKYLYAYRDGSIYQPQYKGVRNDLTDEAAIVRQLKYKD